MKFGKSLDRAMRLCLVSVHPSGAREHYMVSIGRFGLVREMEYGALMMPPDELMEKECLWLREMVHWELLDALDDFDE